MTATIRSPQKSKSSRGFAATSAMPAPLGAAPSAWARLKSLQRDATGLKAHDLVTKGVPVAQVKLVMGAFSLIDEAQIYAVLGISAKTMQRRALRADNTLDSNASDRALRLIAVTTRAIEVLGSQDAAERWLTQPATGLDRRRPIDLLRSSEGTEMLKTLLGRMEYGVYA